MRVFRYPSRGSVLGARYPAFGTDPLRVSVSGARSGGTLPATH